MPKLKRVPKPGDLVKCKISYWDESSNGVLQKHFSKNRTYEVTKFTDDCGYGGWVELIDNQGEKNGWNMKYFKLVDKKES